MNNTKQEENQLSHFSLNDKLLTILSKYPDIPVDLKHDINSLIQDIEEHKKQHEVVKAAKNKAEEDAEKYRLLHENAGIGIGYISPDGIVISFNSIASEDMNGKPEDFAGKSIYELFPKESADAYFERLQKAKSSDKIEVYEDTVKLPTQEKCFLSTYTKIENSNGELLGIQIVSQNISELKQVEKELKVSEDRLKTILDTSPFPIAVVDTNDDKILYWSKSALQLFGHNPKNTQEWYELAYPDPSYRDDVIRRWKPFLELAGKSSEVVNTGEYRIVCKDGSTKICELHAQFIPENLIVTLNDITERKQAEEELLKHREHLEELVKKRTFELETSNTELRAFSYSVSHDLRAPLRAIDGFTSILLEDYGKNLDVEAKRIGKKISDNAQKMGLLIDNLLSFSRVGSSTMTSSKIDMKKMAIATYTEATDVEIRKRISFTVDNLPFAYGDEHLMRIVWMNLISNAIKFSSKQKQAEISITFEEDGANNIYCVNDNGSGFNMKYKHKLFGVFQRLHSEKDYKGTGVGLALTQRILHRHAGKIWANSEIDNGASFYFSLPKQKEGKDEI